MTILNFPYFQKTFLDQSLWIFNWVSEVMMSYPHNLQKMTKISFSGKHVTVNVTFYPPKINEKWCLFWHTCTCTCIFQYRAMLLSVSAKKSKNFNISYIIWQIVRVWHHHLTQLNIHKDWSRSVFRKYGKFQNVLCNFLISYPNFIIFVSFCREFFSSFFLNYCNFGPDFPFKKEKKWNGRT